MISFSKFKWSLASLLLTQIFLVTPIQAQSFGETYFSIKHLDLVDGEGEIIAHKFHVQTPTDEIRYSGADLFTGLVKVADGEIKVSGNNGMGLKTKKEIKLPPNSQFEILDAKYLANDNELALEAKEFKGSAKGFKFYGEQALVTCLTGKTCQGSVGALSLDTDLKLEGIKISCEERRCAENAQVEVSGIADVDPRVYDQKLKTKSIIDVKDLRSLSLRRNKNAVELNGNLKILFGSVGFNVQAEIISYTANQISVKIQKVKVSDLISMKDLTLYLVKKFLKNKNYILQDDVVIFNY